MKIDYINVPKNTKYVDINSKIVPIFNIKIHEPIVNEDFLKILQKTWLSFISSFKNHLNRIINKGEIENCRGQKIVFIKDAPNIKISQFSVDIEWQVGMIIFDTIQENLNIYYGDKDLKVIK